MDLAATIATATTADLFGIRRRQADLRPLRQFRAMRITASQGYFAIDQNQRQCFRSRPPQKTFHDRVVSKNHRLLCQIETLNLPSLAFQPINIGGKSDLLLVYTYATNAGAATKCRVINFNFGLVDLLCIVVKIRLFRWKPMPPPIRSALSSRQAGRQVL